MKTQYNKMLQRIKAYVYIYIILSFIINYAYSNSVITIIANYSVKGKQTMIALDKKSGNSISIKNIDTNQNIGYTYFYERHICGEYELIYFDVVPGRYEIKITTSLKSLSLRCLTMGDSCHFDSVVIKNSGEINITDLSLAFSRCYNLKSVDLSDLDMTGVTGFYRMFEDCQNLISVNFGNLLLKRNVFEM